MDFDLFEVLEYELEAERRRNARISAELGAAREASRREAKRAAVIAVLQSAGAARPERDAVHLLGQVQQDQDGEYVTVRADGAMIPLADTAAEWIGNNPELAAAPPYRQPE